MTPEELQEVTELLGRVPQGRCEVVVRSSLGAPVVLWSAPHLEDGTPMPTLYWLIGRPEREEVSRLEAAGGVKAAEEAVEPAELEAAHARYSEERKRAASFEPGQFEHEPRGGVGGTRKGVKCLHAHLAWFLAGGEDPVGQWTAAKLALAREQYRRT